MRERFRRRKSSGIRTVIKEGGVYLIVNTVTKDTYVGSSCDVTRRWRKHASAMRSKRHPIDRINVLVRRYGLESFRFLLLEPCRSAWFRKERQWLAIFKPTLKHGH